MAPTLCKSNPIYSLVLKWCFPESSYKISEDSALIMQLRFGLRPKIQAKRKGHEPIKIKHLGQKVICVS